MKRFKFDFSTKIRGATHDESGETVRTLTFQNEAGDKLVVTLEQEISPSDLLSDLTSAMPASWY